ncbi:hypothetical protein VNO78_17110 [Psophocarpus tetragonolobus]|uniref:Uncharacterized protein n=1 Tax=Psophocarpus tetragonolobus TaxID=3891 RepID=A0AAN9SIP8_PSOTE
MKGAALRLKIERRKKVEENLFSATPSMGSPPSSPLDTVVGPTSEPFSVPETIKTASNCIITVLIVAITNHSDLSHWNKALCSSFTCRVDGRLILTGQKTHEMQRGPDVVSCCTLGFSMLSSDQSIYETILEAAFVLGIREIFGDILIPRQLCDNVGFDATDVLNKLRQKHALPFGWLAIFFEGAPYGVDIITGGIPDFFANFVWEPAIVKINAINVATEAS